MAFCNLTTNLSLLFPHIDAFRLEPFQAIWLSEYDFDKERACFSNINNHCAPHFVAQSLQSHKVSTTLPYALFIYPRFRKLNIAHLQRRRIGSLNLPNGTTKLLNTSVWTWNLQVLLATLWMTNSLQEAIQLLANGDRQKHRIIHFIRHGDTLYQSYSRTAGLRCHCYDSTFPQEELTHPHDPSIPCPYLYPFCCDGPLSIEGKQNVSNLKFPVDVDLFVAANDQRCLQTAQILNKKSALFFLHLKLIRRSSRACTWATTATDFTTYTFSKVPHSFSSNTLPNGRFFKL